MSSMSHALLAAMTHFMVCLMQGPLPSAIGGLAVGVRGSLTGALSDVNYC